MNRYQGKRYKKVRRRRRSGGIKPAYYILAAAAVVLLAGVIVVSGRGSSSGSNPVIADTGSTGSQTIDNGQAIDAPASTTAAPLNDSPAFETLVMPVSLPNPARTVKLPILMFHHTGEPPAGADQLRRNLTVSTADLEAQMSYLKQAGYQPVTETQLFRALFEGTPLPPKPVMLTFDDGYDDNYQVALPILEKYGFPATFYIITSKVGTPEYMDWSQVVEMDRRGMDVGSHTATHQDLTVLSAADLRQELAGAADTLKSKLGHPVYWLCYPSGKYDADVLRYTKEAGYLLASTTKAGEQQSSDAPLELLRYRVRSDTGVEGFKELVR